MFSGCFGMENSWLFYKFSAFHLLDFLFTLLCGIFFWSNHFSHHTHTLAHTHTFFLILFTSFFFIYFILFYFFFVSWFFLLLLYFIFPGVLFCGNLLLSFFIFTWFSSVFTSFSLFKFNFCNFFWIISYLLY